MTESDRKIIFWGSVAGLIVCAGDFLILFVFGAFYPGYSQLYNTMSSLGATVSPVSDPVSWSWIMLGLLCVFFGYSLRKAFVPADKFVILASWLLIVYGLGEFVGSGVFKADHIGNTITNSAVVHGILGTIGLVALYLMPLAMLKVIPRKENPGFHTLSWTVFGVGIILAILFNFRFFHSTENQLDRLEGLWQRLLAFDFYIYLVVIILTMLKRRNTFSKYPANE
jgi:hypothetical protein